MFNRYDIISALSGAAVLLLLLMSSGGSASAQEVESDIEPWRLVRVFIQETGSPSDEVDRSAFRSRLSGELAALDMESEIVGRWREFVDVTIDTLVPLSPRILTIPPLKVGNPPRYDTLRRLAVFATTYFDGNYDNSYFFLEQDSMWKITHLRQFPTLDERIAIADRAGAVDTTTPDFMLVVKNQFVLLESDRERRTRFDQEIRSDASSIIAQLDRAPTWREIVLGPIATEEIDPYYTLDEGVSSHDAFLHRLNLAALDRLYRNGITRIYRSAEGIALEIGGIGDKSTGYLYRDSTRSGVDLDPDNVFMTSPIDRHWSTYKTGVTPVIVNSGEGVTYDVRLNLESATSPAQPAGSGKEVLLREK